MDALPEELVEDMLLGLEEELPQETCPGDAEANAKVDAMLHDVPGVDGDVPKATFLREMMSGEFGSELGPREGRSEHRGRDMPDGAHFFVQKNAFWQASCEAAWRRSAAGRTQYKLSIHVS